MTPAINSVRKAKVAHQVHEYQHEASSESYGTEAVEKLGLAPELVFKTLVVSLEGKGLAVGVVPVAGKLSLKQIARAAGVKKAAMADPAEVERVTGYVLGGVSPLGQKKRLPTFIDISAQSLQAMHVSAGRRGLEIELSPDDLCRLTAARFAPIAG
ncbi:Cys-tRNA(Pro) deacylase [Marinobacterium marinum]|uniref:Cys-tRNA(Pro)/Cys-tRNA(Cys) deacylase n=1 Tax=Marinobacterium marinum TaxID=2756129 RepID=A0A7W1WVG1_9GAMM|nr:Cys-tRNA(Pro) deacylase [Marinobacterium marinum]MBA4500964.1 Cys-tRNA(Pro) deacylase [Marinobacterium marinum]